MAQRTYLINFTSWTIKFLALILLINRSNLLMDVTHSKKITKPNLIKLFIQWQTSHLCIFFIKDEISTTRHHKRKIQKTFKWSRIWNINSQLRLQMNLFLKVHLRLFKWLIVLTRISYKNHLSRRFIN